MTEVGVEIIGLAEFEKKLKALDEAVRGKKLELALVSGGLLIAGPAKHKAPAKTGNLRRSLHVGGYTDRTPDFKDAKDCTDVGGNISTGDTAEIKIGTNLIYARIQEYGGTINAKNKPYLVFKTKDGSWHSVTSVTIPAHPYMRPAFDEHHGAAVTEVGKALKILIEKAAT